MLPPSTPTTGTEDSIRVMTPEEIKAEEPIFASTGNPLPNPATSTFLGVFRGGKRVAFLVLQLRLHTEPLYIEEGHSAVLPALVKAAEEYILRNVGPQWVYLFAPAGRITQLAQAMGMQLEPYCVLSKLVLPEAPAKGTIDLSVPPLLDESTLADEAIQ